MISTNTTSDSGQWSTYLPSLSTWNITVEDRIRHAERNCRTRETSLIEDIEISAGEVKVSGTISYLDQNCVSGGEWSVFIFRLRNC